MPGTFPDVRLAGTPESLVSVVLWIPVNVKTSFTETGFLRWSVGLSGLLFPSRSALSVEGSVGPWKDSSSIILFLYFLYVFFVLDGLLHTVVLFVSLILSVVVS